MRIAVFFNPIAGRGRAKRLAESSCAALEAAGHVPLPVETGPGSLKSDKDEALSEAHALAVVGGDGTVHALAPLASEHRTPLYHVPTGTENLFAREFNMTRDPADLLAAIELLEPDDPCANVPLIDMGVCNGRTFLLMASIGFDANVVHRLAHNRRGSISHLSYVPHIAWELLSHKPSKMRIEAEGETIVEHATGWVVVANARQYALRCDPAREADPSDGLLDVVFLPYGSLPSLVMWNMKCRFGWHMRSGKVVRARASRVLIETERPERYQLDGEAPLDTAGRSDLGPAATPLEITVRPAMLPVMTPTRRLSAIPALPADGDRPAPAVGLRGALARAVSRSSSG